MIEFDAVKNFYPPYLRENALYHKYILKEYILIMILDFLSSSSYVKKLAFIDGTSIRLTRGIDRFSEDLDFDCKDFHESDFNNMTDDVFIFCKKVE
ncbi:MAG: nucleotidyl transferase AbiEii/AbiGii toxin family protein [Melioribacteraceae bacterium]|nr:nucleotidyl transferase AbiEii/AbiGii toxin family protein [Melioribacteraceae bacterium]